MGETPGQIERHIERTRSELGENFDELQSKVKQATDWKVQFGRHPWTGLAIAFAGGVTLSALAARSSAHPDRGTDISRDRGAEQNAYPVKRPFAAQSNKAMQTWDNIKRALVVVAGMGLKRVFDEALPGFREEFHKAEREGAARGNSREND
jgi:hypothetical protein